MSGNPLLHIVLHEPEIPNNTGNIGRTCIATGCRLHLIEPLGFDTSEKACRRAGLDYWPRLNPAHHASWDAFRHAQPALRTWFFSTKAATTAHHAAFQPGDALVFGKETRGLPDHLLRAHPDSLVSLPMIAGERSLNLATAVCAAIYLAIDQFARAGSVNIGPDGRLVLPSALTPP